MILQKYITCADPDFFPGLELEVGVKGGGVRGLGFFFFGDFLCLNLPKVGGGLDPRMHNPRISV